jgi:hypothetical protein
MRNDDNTDWTIIDKGEIEKATFQFHLRVWYRKPSTGTERVRRAVRCRKLFWSPGIRISITYYMAIKEYLRRAVAKIHGHQSSAHKRALRICMAC